MSEHFGMRQIEGYEKYFISESGRVFSFKTGIYKELSQYPNEKGYLKVWLYNKGKRKMFYVHRLVLLAYEPIENSELYEVNHKDGKTDNNKLSNLEWTTQEENLKHAFENFRVFHQTPENIKRARELSALGVTTTQIAKELNCSRASVYNMLKGWV